MKSPNIFFTSDTHYNHIKIIGYENRPYNDIDEMNENLIENYNRVVKPGDIIYHLGDFAWGKEEDIAKILRRLNGNKRLIYGNHDWRIRKNKSLQKYFGWCKDYYIIEEFKVPIILFHFPILEWDRYRHGSIHLYGHIHKNYIIYNPDRSYNVGVDVNKFTPVALEDILSWGS